MSIARDGVNLEPRSEQMCLIRRTDAEFRPRMRKMRAPLLNKQRSHASPRVTCGRLVPTCCVRRVKRSRLLVISRDGDSFYRAPIIAAAGRVGDRELEDSSYIASIWPPSLSDSRASRPMSLAASLALRSISDAPASLRPLIGA